MRGWVMLAPCLVLALAACGSDDESGSAATSGASATTTEASAPVATGAPTSPPAAATTAAEPDEPEPTGAPATTATPAAAASEPVAAIVPRVLCIRMPGNGAVFGYVNESDTPVLLELGPGNQLTGSDPADNPLVTTLFAPGEVTAAFWAYSAGFDASEMAWTVTGPDGVERTAVADDTTPVCPSPFDDPAETRAPTVQISPALASDGDSLDVTVTVTGLPEDSVCPAPFTPEQVAVAIGPGAVPSGYVTEGVTTYGITRLADGSADLRINSDVYVIDSCSYDGTTVRSWSLDLFDQVSTTTCVFVNGTEIDIDVPGRTCGIPGTGGSLSRPG